MTKPSWQTTATASCASRKDDSHEHHPLRLAARRIRAYCAQTAPTPTRRHAAHPPNARRRHDPAAFHVFGYPKRTKRFRQAQRVAANYPLYGNRRVQSRQRCRPQPVGTRCPPQQNPFHQQAGRLGRAAIQPRPKPCFHARRQPLARRIYRNARSRYAARTNAGDLSGYGQAAHGRIRHHGHRMGANAVSNQRVHPQNFMVSFTDAGHGVRPCRAQHHPSANPEPQRRN